METRYIVIRTRGDSICGIYKNLETAKEWIESMFSQCDYYINEIDWEV